MKPSHALFSVIERLESRCLLSAGAVSAAVVNGCLIVIGDNEQNVVRLDGLGLSAGEIRVSGLGANTVNGHLRSQVFGGVTKGASVELARGDDLLVVASLDLGGGLEIYGGRGNDSVRLDTFWTAAGVSVFAADGNDQVALARASVRRAVLIDGGDGADSLDVASSAFRGAVALVTSGATGAGGVVRAADCRFAGRFSAQTAAGADQVALAGSTFLAGAAVKTGDGDDTIFLGGSSFATAPDLNGEAGNNIVQQDGISKTFDFRDGSQGWLTGFSDFEAHPTITDSNGITTNVSPEHYYELKSGLHALPSELGLSGTGIELGGHNRSDDLYMFLERQLGPADGILPGASYRLSFWTDLASFAPSGAGGAGGAPGEGVFLKVGATQVEPLPIESNGEILMNVDKGIQANDGPAGRVVGDVANGIIAERVLPDIMPYASVQRHGTPQTIATADGSGNLWVLIGTDSGFEGITSLYYQRIGVTLARV